MCKYFGKYFQNIWVLFDKTNMATGFSLTPLWGLNCNNSNFANASNPFLIRGGNYNNGSNTGMFNFNNTNGNVSGNNGFRPVLAV